MPKNKEALIRYRVINRCLKDYGYVTKEKIIKTCEDVLDIHPIGERTIDGDIHAMRFDNGLGYYAPIVYDRSKNAYCYKDPDYSIDNIPLNNDEVQSLAFAATLLDQFKGVEIFNRFTGSVQKIIDAININRSHEDKGTMDFIDFEKVPFVKGSEFLDTLIKAIHQKKVIHLKYRSFQAEHDHQHDIHPYLLKEFRNRWYLIGYHDYFKEISTFGLDRIISISDQPKKEYINSNFSPEQYFKNSIGIFSPGEAPPEIILQFNKEAAQYIITQPIHESQKIVEETDDSVTFSLMVHPTVELIQIILGWGGEVKVIKPLSLKNKILKMVNSIKELYKQ